MPADACGMARGRMDEPAANRTRGGGDRTDVQNVGRPQPRENTEPRALATPSPYTPRG